VKVGSLQQAKCPAHQKLQSVVRIASEAGHAVQEGTFAVITSWLPLSLNLGNPSISCPFPIRHGGNILLLALEGASAAETSDTA